MAHAPVRAVRAPTARPSGPWRATCRRVPVGQLSKRR